MLPYDFASLAAALAPPLAWLLPSVATGVLVLWWLHRRGRAGGRVAARRLRRLFGDVADDLILPDGHGGLIHIDHLALTAKGLLVVDVSHHEGVIVGRGQDPSWTQSIGNACYRFRNPLRRHLGHVRAVEALVPGVPVHGRVVFAGRACFSRTPPAGVVPLAELRRDLAVLAAGEVPARYQRDWQLVRAQARTDWAARKLRQQAIRERRRVQAAQRTLSRDGGLDAFGRGSDAAVRLGDLARPMLLGIGTVAVALWLLATLRPASTAPTMSLPPPIAYVSADTADTSGTPAAPPEVPPAPASPRPPPPRHLPAFAPPNEEPGDPVAAARRTRCNLAIAALVSHDSADNRMQRRLSCGFLAARDDAIHLRNRPAGGAGSSQLSSSSTAARQASPPAHVISTAAELPPGPTTAN